MQMQRDASDDEISDILLVEVGDVTIRVDLIVI